MKGKNWVVRTGRRKGEEKCGKGRKEKNVRDRKGGESIPLKF